MSLSSLITDPVSNLYNESYFEHRLEEEIVRSERYQIPLSVVLMEVDGSDELKERSRKAEFLRTVTMVSEIIEREIRLTDIACRLDDLTFGIILTNTDLDGASIFANRLSNSIKKLLGKTTSMVIMRSSDDHLTISLERSYEILRDIQIDGGDQISICE